MSTALKFRISHKITTECFYKVARAIGRRHVIKKFNPMIIGEENLPTKKGPDVFVSNHRSVKDSIITIAMLKNPTHFAALKRMFEYFRGIGYFGV